MCRLNNVECVNDKNEFRDPQQLWHIDGHHHKLLWQLLQPLSQSQGSRAEVEAHGIERIYAYVTITVLETCGSILPQW